MWNEDERNEKKKRKKEGKQGRIKEEKKDKLRRAVGSKRDVGRDGEAKER